MSWPISSRLNHILHFKISHACSWKRQNSSEIQWFALWYIGFYCIIKIYPHFAMRCVRTQCYTTSLNVQSILYVHTRILNYLPKTQIVILAYDFTRISNKVIFKQNQRVCIEFIFRVARVESNLGLFLFKKSLLLPKFFIFLNLKKNCPIFPF